MSEFKSAGQLLEAGYQANEVIEILRYQEKKLRLAEERERQYLDMKAAKRTGNYNMSPLQKFIEREYQAEIEERAKEEEKRKAEALSAESLSLVYKYTAEQKIKAARQRMESFIQQASSDFAIEFVARSYSSSRQKQPEGKPVSVSPYENGPRRIRIPD